MKLNKKGVTLLDAVIAITLLGLMTMMFYTSIQIYTKYTTRADKAIYTGFALTECAEVIQSMRYGEWDKDGTLGWDTYLFNYPTGLYQMDLNTTTNVWDLLPIYIDIPNEIHYINFRDMLRQTGYTPDTLGENFLIGEKNIQIRRYVFLDNSIPNKSIAHCYVKYMDPYFLRKTHNNENDIFNYEELKLIMTNYK